MENGRFAIILKSFCTNVLSDDWDVTNSDCSEHAAVTFDFHRRTESFRVIIGKLNGWAAFDAGDFADQADGIEATVAAGVAAAEIVGEQRAPTGAETNAAAGSPLASVIEVGGAAEIAGGGAAGQSSSEVCMQAKDLVDVERVGGDDQFAVRIAAAGLQPSDIFIAGYIRIFAVNALASPVGGPVRCALEELRGSECVGQHDAERAVVGFLPQVEDLILRRFQSFVIIWRRQRG